MAASAMGLRDEKANAGAWFAVGTEGVRGRREIGMAALVIFEELRSVDGGVEGRLEKVGGKICGRKRGVQK